jgi:hypothetical protein
MKTSNYMLPFLELQTKDLIREGKISLEYSEILIEILGESNKLQYCHYWKLCINEVFWLKGHFKAIDSGNSANSEWPIT